MGLRKDSLVKLVSRIKHHTPAEYADLRELQKRYKQSQNTNQNQTSESEQPSRRS